MRIIGVALLAIATPVVAQAQGATPAGPATTAVAPTPAPDRDKQIEDWGRANAPAVKAAVSVGDLTRSADRLRAIVPAVAPLSDTEICDLLIAAADAFNGIGEHASALLLGQTSLDWASLKKLPPGYYYDALSRTGSARYAAADFAGAARDLSASVERAREIQPFSANAVANATANHAVVLDAGGRYREALLAFETAIKLRLSVTPVRVEGLAITYAAQAAVNKRMGRWDLAEANYRKALNVMEVAEMTTGRQFTRVLHNYAVFVSDQGRDEEAVKLYQRVLDLTPADKRMASNMIPDYSTMAGALGNLGRHDEADRTIAVAIAIVEKQPKPTADTGYAYANRAALKEDRGDLAAAEADRRHALAIDRIVYRGDRNLPVAVDLLALSAILRKRDNLAEAQRYAAEAVAMSDVIPDLNPLRAVILDGYAASLVSGSRGPEALASSRLASELLARRFELDRERDPGPMPAEQRPIMGRRIALAWDAAHP